MNPEFNVYSLPRIIIFIASSAIGLFVLLKNKKSPINRSFFILAMSTSLWQFCYIVVSHVNDSASAMLWSKLAYCGVVFISSSTYHFISSLLNLKEKRLIYLFYAFSSFSIFAVMGDFLFVDMQRYFWGYYPKVHFISHSIFLFLWTIPFILSLTNLYKAYGQAQSSFNKKRIKYFLVTLPIAYLGMIDYIPNYGINIYPFGLIPVTFFIISTTYAILRYRLLDTEIMVKRLSLISSGFVISIGLVYIGTFYLEPYLSAFWGKGWIIFPVSVSFLVSLWLLKFINFVRRIEENELSKKFAYRPLLKKEAERISMVRNINELLIYITRDLSNWVGLDYVGIFIWDDHKKEFYLARSLNRAKNKRKAPEGFSLNHDNPLVVELLRKRKPLVCSEIEYNLNSKAAPLEEKEFLFRVIAQMQQLGAEISIPSFCEKKLLAIINIGQKLSPREIITSEDLEAFFSLANNIARAIYGFMLKEEKIQLIVASQNILITAIEAKDRYTRGHTDRVANYSTLIGKSLEKQLRFFSNGLSDLNWAAMLHDVGKISIPDTILLKPGPLTEEEWEKVKEHPTNGIKIINPVREWLGEDVCAGILQHHENYDGSGYPFGQKEEDIHLFARIIRVADAFDAMTTDRPYRLALRKEEAMTELKRYKAVHFDPFVVETMEELYNNEKI
ncbi:MAG: HD domain-containing protein [Candidatus Omnitrophica bacterium]|nr:HD domain-containing protein [Candidatus Omnitrophota bacterium]